MGIWRLNELGFQGVDVPWIVQVIDHELGVLLMDAFVVQEVLHLDEVHSHLDHLLNEILLALSEEVNLLLIAA